MNSNLSSSYAVSWSGGKDSTLALYKSMKKWGKPRWLITMMIEDGSRSRSHGLRKEVLEMQAQLLGLPIRFYPCSWDSYEAVFQEALAELKGQGIQGVVFGDIQIPHDPNWSTHRQWADDMCYQAGLISHQPLWGMSHHDLITAFFTNGFQGIFICLKEDFFSKDLLGTPLSESRLRGFESIGVDPLGERGEYHTLVTNGPLFQRPMGVVLPQENIQKRHGYWHADVVLTDKSFQSAS